MPQNESEDLKAGALHGALAEGVEGASKSQFKALYGLVVNFDALLTQRIYIISEVMPSPAAKTTPRRKKKRLTVFHESDSVPLITTGQSPQENMMNSDTAPKTRKAKEVYNRAVVQVVDADAKTFKILEDCGPCPTLKAQQVKRKLEKAGNANLAVIYWVG